MTIKNKYKNINTLWVSRKGSIKMLQGNEVYSAILVGLYAKYTKLYIWFLYSTKG